MNVFKFILVVCFSLLAFSLQAEKQYYVSACAIFRDEARFLKEWIEFHRLQGIEHFYLLNNLSEDNYKKVLMPYLEKDIVELFEWNFETTDPGRWSPIQCSAYQKIIDKVKKRTKWLAILDTDEFLFLVDGTPLQSFLKNFEQYGAVGVNWQMFGTGGVPRIPQGKLLIETLNLRAPQDYSENIHVKCIVQPAYVENCPSPHFCSLRGNTLQVNENKESFAGPFSPYISVDKIRINHYWSRDEEFFYRVKIPRRNKWGEGAEGCIRRESYLNAEFDDTIHRFCNKLRKKCEIKTAVSKESELESAISWEDPR